MAHQDNPSVEVLVTHLMRRSQIVAAHHASGVMVRSSSTSTMIRCH
ncbi:hypothetical protein RRSWK_01641 [Rhodopirellula sp. SWK7]|nr:hypothetical protein RRSWK_01641 [Rhodopirellula sp. SWK7]